MLESDHQEPALLFTGEIRANTDVATWRRFVRTFLAAFVGVVAGAYLFVLLLDPYLVVPFSLPIERKIVSISQRYIYPQVVRSGNFDSLIVGTSTSRLIDPERLNAPFGGRFVNLAMDSMTAWEQATMLNYFINKRGAPKVLIVALDRVWCEPSADRERTTFRGFPEWLYDDNPWNDYLYLLNTPTLEIAGRLVGNRLGFYPERVRYDGFEVFVPPESAYDAARARTGIWGGRAPQPLSDAPQLLLSDAERRALSFPALNWLSESLARIPSTLKILAFMPVHIAAQPPPGSHAAAYEDECKRRIAAIAGEQGAKLLDWRIASPITREDTNYWDALHYRLPIAQRIADDLVNAVLNEHTAPDGSYRILVR